MPHPAPAESLPAEGAAGSSASCASPGCWCRDRRPRYPSDFTDQQWAVLEPRAREVIPALTVAVGRPMVHDLRAMCDAIAYVVKIGVEWRALPVDFHLGRRCMRSPNAAASDVPGPPVRISQTHKKPGDDE